MQVILDGTKLPYLSSRALGPYIGDGLWLVVNLASDDPRAEKFKARWCRTTGRSCRGTTTRRWRCSTCTG